MKNRTNKITSHPEPFLIQLVKYLCQQVEHSQLVSKFCSIWIKEKQPTTNYSCVRASGLLKHNSTQLLLLRPMKNDNFTYILDLNLVLSDSRGQNHRNQRAHTSIVPQVYQTIFCICLRADSIERGLSLQATKANQHLIVIGPQQTSFNYLAWLTEGWEDACDTHRRPCSYTSLFILKMHVTLLTPWMLSLPHLKRNEQTQQWNKKETT